MTWYKDPKVIGAYATKEAAVAAASTVDTEYGTFDEAIKTMFDEGDFDHKDNRGNPPDDGMLIQIGSAGSGI